MITNYIKLAIRSLLNNKGISAINIIGLSVGLACFYLFMLNGLNEFSFDRFHANARNLYAVYEDIGEIQGNAAQKYVDLPMPLGPALKADFSDVRRFARVQGQGESFFIRSPKGLLEEQACFVDPAFFEMFSFPSLYGNAAAALASNSNVVLTLKMAQKLFGESNPVGKMMEINILGGNRFEPFTVSAVVQDPPSNSTLQFGIVMPVDKFAASERGRQCANDWAQLSMKTYVELQNGSDLPNDPARLAQFFRKYYPDVEKTLRDNGMWSKAEAPVTFGLLAIQSLHHHPELGVNPALSLILLAIAGIILLIACINFTTLSIGRSAGRAREIGVRKVVGANRWQLSRQFMVEAVLTSTLSTAIGMVLAIGLLPIFNQLSDKHLEFDFRHYPELFALVPGLDLLVGCLAGIYPAFVLSRIPTLDSLKRKLKIGGENLFTKSLVTFQFVLSVGLMTSTFIMLRQLDFLRSKNPGFDKENVVIVNADGSEDPVKTLAGFRRSLAGRPEISAISGAGLSLGGEAGLSNSKFDYQGKSKVIFEYFIDPEYLGVLKIPLLAGRNFDPNIVKDSVTSVILNESAVRDFGWTPETAIGQVLSGYNPVDEKRDPVVIGVVRDFNFRSFREKVYPMMFTMFHDYMPRQFFVRLKPGDPRQVLDQMQSAWTRAEPLIPFRYSFLDENLQKFYTEESRISKMVGLAGSIAVFLACLGLFGLATLSTLNRTKEIGIRKVLGASVAGITALLSRDFLKLVLLAIFIASPIAWYFMNNWLSNFAYRIDLRWWAFAVTGGIAITIAFLTVSYQSIRAAMANPVDSLRND